MFNQDDVERAVVEGPSGEWDEPNLVPETHPTAWREDFEFALDRPRWTHGRQISPGLRWNILHKCGHACVHCGATEQLQVDHIRPVSHGGDDSEENLQILCRLCNLRKGNQSESRWLKWNA